MVFRRNRPAARYRTQSNNQRPRCRHVQGSLRIGRTTAVPIFLAVGLLGCGGGGSSSGVTGTSTQASAQTPSPAQAATGTSTQTAPPAQMSTDGFCGDRDVTAAVDSVIGGSASCKSTPTTGFRPGTEHGTETDWSLNPVGVSVGVAHYAKDVYRYLYRSLGMTNPAASHGTDITVSGEQCVYQTIGVLVCFPGGQTAINITSGSSRVSSISQYETVARAVIAARAR